MHVKRHLLKHKLVVENSINNKSKECTIIASSKYKLIISGLKLKHLKNYGRLIFKVLVQEINYATLVMLKNTRTSKRL